MPKKEVKTCPKCGHNSAEITGKLYLCNKCYASGGVGEIAQKKIDDIAKKYALAAKVAIVRKEVRMLLDANEREAAVNLVASGLECSPQEAEQIVVGIETEDQKAEAASNSGCAGVLLVLAVAVAGRLYCLM